MALAVAGVALYAVVSHELTTRATESGLTLAVVLGPMALSLVGAAWAAGQRGLAAGLGIAALLAAGAASQGRGVPAPWLYLAQHAGLHAALAIWFAASLRGTAMITRLASRLHALTPDMRAYTRRCTVAWIAYFAGIAGVSLLLFAIAPWEAWSLFANVLTPLSLAAMFIGEHVLRYRLHPEFERVGLAAAARAFSVHR